MNKTHLVVKGTPKFDGTGGATIPNLKGTDSNSNLKKPNQSEVLFFLLAGQLVHVTWSCSFIIG